MSIYVRNLETNASHSRYADLSTSISIINTNPDDGWSLITFYLPQNLSKYDGDSATRWSWCLYWLAVIESDRIQYQCWLISGARYLQVSWTLYSVAAVIVILRLYAQGRILRSVGHQVLRYYLSRPTSGKYLDFSRYLGTLRYYLVL